jgi:hypothetical protein
MPTHRGSLRPQWIRAMRGNAHLCIGRSSMAIEESWFGCWTQVTNHSIPFASDECNCILLGMLCMYMCSSSYHHDSSVVGADAKASDLKENSVEMAERRAKCGACSWCICVYTLYTHIKPHTYTHAHPGASDRPDGARASVWGSMPRHCRSLIICVLLALYAVNGTMTAK